MTQSKARRAVEGRLDFPRHYGANPPALKEPENVTVAGFDIEADSQSADPYLICANVGHDLKHPHTTSGKSFKKSLTSAHEALDFLTQPSFQHTINGFWNIGYDSEGMLRFFPDAVKYMLSKNPEVFLKDDLTQATKQDYTFHIRLIPKKAFSIRTIVSPINRFYDFAQFYDKERLQSVAKRLLGDEKEDFDASKSDLEAYFNNREYREKVESYCLHDATLTRRIGEKLVSAIHTFLPTKNFTSRATIAEQYFIRNGYRTPQLMRNVSRPFQKTYWGGRFEMTKYGFIEETHHSDLKSAYPAAMAEMPILTDTTEAIRCHDEFTKDALFGAYKISVDIPKNAYIGPVPFQPKQGPIIYPVGHIAETWVDKVTLTYLNRKGYDFQIFEGLELFDANATKSLEKPIKHLFSMKENNAKAAKRNALFPCLCGCGIFPPKEGFDEGICNSCKIIMNSGYGKTIQTVDDVIGKLVSLEEALKQNANVDSITPEGIFVTEHTGVFKVGGMFNPAYAAHITATPRIQLLEAAESIGWESVIAFQTDSIAATKKLPSNPVLGGWEYKGRYDFAISKSGMYELQTSGSDEMDRAWKIFNRPHEIKARSYNRISSIAEPSYQVKRRVSLKECATKHDFSNLNLIHTVKLDNDINTDKKRVWDSPLSFEDLRPWGKVIDSKPIEV